MDAKHVSYLRGRTCFEDVREEKMIESLRKLHIKEHRYFCSSPDIVRVIKCVRRDEKGLCVLCVDK
jgi:ectoine hydroxylase-related dioxygenase (phytanoyl-CoA dioxygenase family)